ncbi:MAG: hypothetical protein KBS52_05475 [Clostridiales bacterium]|nr:hypothetical protein [Candidatus Equinaster intestinalis]
MKNTEHKLKKLFDFQKFNKNPKLNHLIEETESGGVELTDEELALVNAAGETRHGRIEADSGPGQAGIGTGNTMP